MAMPLDERDQKMQQLSELYERTRGENQELRAQLIDLMERECKRLGNDNAHLSEQIHRINGYMPAGYAAEQGAFVKTVREIETRMRDDLMGNGQDAQTAPSQYGTFTR